MPPCHTEHSAVIITTHSWCASNIMNSPSGNEIKLDLPNKTLQTVKAKLQSELPIASLSTHHSSTDSIIKFVLLPQLELLII